MFEEQPTVKVQTSIFTQHIPIVGKIPMGNFKFKLNISYIVFYLPDCDSAAELSKLIEENGGKVTD